MNVIIYTHTLDDGSKSISLSPISATICTGTDDGGVEYAMPEGYTQDEEGWPRSPDGFPAFLFQRSDGVPVLSLMGGKDEGKDIPLLPRATAAEKYNVETNYENDGSEQWYTAWISVPTESEEMIFQVTDPWSGTGEEERTLTVGAAIAAGIVSPGLLKYYNENDLVEYSDHLLPEVLEELKKALNEVADEYYAAEVCNRFEEIIEVVEGKDVVLYAIYSPRRFYNELDGYAILREHREAFEERSEGLDPSKCWIETGDREWFEGKLRHGIGNLVEMERYNRNTFSNPPEGVQDLVIWGEEEEEY